MRFDPHSDDLAVRLALAAGVLLVLILLGLVMRRALRSRAIRQEAGDDDEPVEDELPEQEQVRAELITPVAPELPEPIPHDLEPLPKPEPAAPITRKPAPERKEPQRAAVPEPRPEPVAKSSDAPAAPDLSSPGELVQAEQERAARAARAEQERMELAAQAERIRKERQAREKAERQEWARREKAEKAAREKAAREDRERAEQAAREDRERAERAAAAERERAEREREATRLEQERQARELMQPSRSLADGLARTKKEGFVGRLARLFTGRKTIDQELLDQVEETLIKADLGVHTTERLVARLKEESGRIDVSRPEAVWSFLQEESAKILRVERGPMVRPTGRPWVLMVIGVNGVGKTTTIGKLGARYLAEGSKVLLAAGDTFRAAAVEQLEVWAGRIGAGLVKGRPDADPASVVFNAIQQGKKDGVDVVIADTAGRLHTKVNLMEELKKIHRVCSKAIEGTPDEILLVLDSTNGQNAVAQARQFKEAIGVTGIILTKLDGTAKGGIILAIAEELKLPIRFIGIGEQPGDLRPFDPAEFVEALFQHEDRPE